MDKIYRLWKLILGENSSSGKINCGGKFSSGKNIRHLTEISSLFLDEVFPDKVSFHKKQVFTSWITSVCLKPRKK